MRKQLILAALALLLLCGCAKTKEPMTMIQPVTFYYRTAKTDYASEDGVIQAEVRDLGDGSFTDYQIFSKYFEGPVSEELVSPISQDTTLSTVNRSGSRLDIHLKQDINSPAELDHTLTYACLVKTGLALEGVSEVRIYVKSQGGARMSDNVYTASSFLLYDYGEAPNTMDITLYYVDETANLLLPEKRTVPLMSDQQLFFYVLDLLSSQPQSGQSSLPPGTALMEDVKLQNGVCTVDFYPPDDDLYPSDTYYDAAKRELTQRLEVLSVVNTLCKLDNIDEVQIYVYGSQVEPGENSVYEFLDLSEPWTADSSVIGPIREELGEFVGVLCLPGQKDDLLHRLTVRARAKGGVSREEALLSMLLARTAQNGLAAPFTDTPTIAAVSTKEGVCTVKLGLGSLPVDEVPRSLAIRSIAATLATLPEIEAVIILEDGVPVSEEPIQPREEWFMNTR